MDHAPVGVDVAAMQMKQVLRHVGRHGFIIARLPRPVRRGVVHAQKEGGLLCGHALHIVHRAPGDQVGQVALVGLLADFCAIRCVQVMQAIRGAMGEVVHAAGHGTEELLVARGDRAEGRWVAQMPFADQRRAVALRAQQRGQGGVLGRQAQRGAVAAPAVDRLLGCTAQAVLKARRHQGEAGGRADR